MSTHDIQALTEQLWRACNVMRAPEAFVLTGFTVAPPDPETARYFDCLPEEDAVLYGVRFMGPPSILMENTELIPGCFISRFGFVVFASLECGDVFAVELASGEVCLIPTGKYESAETISPGWNEARSDFLPDLPMTLETIKDTADATFGSISQFLSLSLSDQRG